MKGNFLLFPFICFYFLFGIGSFQWVMADSNRKNSRPRREPVLVANGDTTTRCRRRGAGRGICGGRVCHRGDCSSCFRFKKENVDEFGNAVGSRAIVNLSGRGAIGEMPATAAGRALRYQRGRGQRSRAASLPAFGRDDDDGDREGPAFTGLRGGQIVGVLADDHRSHEARSVSQLWPGEESIGVVAPARARALLRVGRRQHHLSNRS
jgi:hypothetical protein